MTRGSGSYRFSQGRLPFFMYGLRFIAKGFLEAECRMTHEALTLGSESADLQRLRELVRNIEAEDEPAQLGLLFGELRTLVGLPQVDSVSQTGNLSAPSFGQTAEK